MGTIAGLPAFLTYFGLALALVALYLATYLAATAHREIALIRAGNTAAALALGASLLGYALPLAVAIYNARSLLDCAAWGLVALVVQIGVYWLVRLPLPDLSERIERNETAAGTVLAFASLAGGLLNAASMTS